MILPGNSRQVLIEALQGLTEAPNIAASKAVNDLDDAGFRIVNHEELSGIVEGLLTIIDTYDRGGSEQMNPAVLRARALLEVLNP